MNKLIILIISLILLILLVYTISYLTNISLPYMSCGGSTLRGLSNQCFPGFQCISSTVPNIPGAGGICLPI
ncbi:MAG: hypothetical protein V1858_04320 [Candidatus Gottesmanbacteria bacterium]